jgi:putative SOS response-associated peptidase YedK
MCGRYARFSPAHIYRMLFELEEIVEMLPQFNIAPGQSVYAVRGIPLRKAQSKSTTSKQENRQQTFSKEMDTLRWGLIPFWAKDPKIGYRLINARSETAAKKPSFRTPFKKRRCLIPADGFYEWQKQKDDPKQPFFIHRNDKKPFAFGGLWDSWQSEEKKETIESCTILTTRSNSLVKSIHDRMPVIIPEEKYDFWLNPLNDDTDSLQELLEPYDEKIMEAYPVSQYVNNPKNKGKKCIEEKQPKYKQTKLF